MTDFRFFHPIEVRYGDLDPQGHVNNARYLTYMEQARIVYFRQLGLWSGDSFMDIGIILADIHIVYILPILFGHPLRVGASMIRLGNKSMTMEYHLENAQTRQEYATGTSVLVAYDYHRGKTIPIPDHWRQVIREFEKLSETS
jgi:acyl-CoA thioester hydrolase